MLDFVRISTGRQGRLLLASTALVFGIVGIAEGSNHSDAPLSKQDPQTNLTDVYAFVGNKYNDANVRVLNIVVNVRPFSEPGDGVMYDRFADDARYSIHLANPTTGETLVRYDYFFSAVDGTPKNPNTVLSYGLGTEAGPLQNINDARRNYVQTYPVIKATGNHNVPLDNDLLTAPPNVGGRVTPL